MKKIFTLAVCVAMTLVCHAQKNDSVTAEYRRSSLCMFLMDGKDGEGDTGEKKGIIHNAFRTAPFFDKFNDHNVGERIFNIDASITDDDRKAFDILMNPTAAQGASSGKKKGGFGAFAKGLAKSTVNDATGGATGTDEKMDFAIKANRFFVQEKIAKQLVDKWFVDNSGKLSVALTAERGLYGASQSDIESANKTPLGNAKLADAGMDLVNNTFIVACRYRYLSKEQLVEMIDKVAQATAAVAGGGYASLGASAGTMAVKASLGAGYYVVTTSYLFKLNWNEETMSKLFSDDVWNNIDNYNKATDIFGLSYIGSQSAWANVKAGIFTNKKEDELIEIATINATDAVVAKLEKKYDVFKTKTPLIVDPANNVLKAQIGMKEGVEGKDKFEVLEKIEDADGRITYKRKGIITVKKDHIWDNRYKANEAPDYNSAITETHFEGKVGDFYSGMLIRQIN